MATMTKPKRASGRKTKSLPKSHKKSRRRPFVDLKSAKGVVRVAPVMLKAKLPLKHKPKPLPQGPSPYAKALDFLLDHTDYERIGVVRYNTTTFNLDRMRICLRAGNPHQKVKTAHVAGTKGKGSTCHMLATMLQFAGFKTGLYTSPHLMDCGAHPDQPGK